MLTVGSVKSKGENRHRPERVENFFLGDVSISRRRAAAAAI